MLADTVDVALDELFGYMQRHTTMGFLRPDELSDLAAELFADEIDPAVLRYHVQRFGRLLQEERQAEQAHWPIVTDCERLDAAFAALERAGVVCRQHFTCCGSCGAATIWDEMAAAEDAGAKVLGYAFFHAQDTEAAIAGDGLFLSYGAVADGPEAAEAIGRAIVDELEAKGLETAWDGQWTRRIFVAMDWKRR